MGNIVAFVNQKGGTGKSSTSVHFTVWLATKLQKQVLLIDADPQRSSSLWLQSMDTKILAVTLDSADDILDQLPQLESECEYLVVDGPAGLAEPTRAILLRADLAVVPVQPTGLDIHSASDTVRLIRQAQSVRGRIPTAAMFLSRAQKGTKLKDEAMTLLTEIPDVTMLHAVIHQKQALADAFGQAATVWDLGKGALSAAREYEQLFQEIMEIVP